MTILCAFGLLTPALARTPSPRGPARTAGVAAIEAYCKALDGFKKRRPARVFGNVAAWDQSGLTLSEPTPEWREFESRRARQSAATGDNLYDVADVWVKDGKVVAADFEYGSPSGDWSQLVTYYYREDGTLAKTRNTFASFHIRGRIVKEIIYGADGKRLQTRLRCFELGENGRGRKKRCSGDYSTYDAGVYARVQSLPLYALLTSRR
jgi:hypothetical protein